MPRRGDPDPIGDRMRELFDEIDAELNRSGAIPMERIDFEDGHYWTFSRDFTAEERNIFHEKYELLGLGGPGEFLAGTYGFPVHPNDEDAARFTKQLEHTLERVKQGDIRGWPEIVRHTLTEHGWTYVETPDPHTLEFRADADRGKVHLKVGLDVYFWPQTVVESWEDNSFSVWTDWDRLTTWNAGGKYPTPDRIAWGLEMSQYGSARIPDDALDSLST